MVRGGRHKACVPQAARRTSPSTAPWFAHIRIGTRAGLAVMYRSTPENADDKASGGGSARGTEPSGPQPYRRGAKSSPPHDFSCETRPASNFQQRDGVDAPYSAASRCHSVVVIKSATIERGRPPCRLAQSGIDLSKTVFQIHAVDADGKTVVRKRLRRAEVLSFFAGLEPCLIGMEACATSHYWARERQSSGIP